MENKKIYVFILLFIIFLVYSSALLSFGSLTVKECLDTPTDPSKITSTNPISKPVVINYGSIPKLIKGHNYTANEIVDAYITKREYLKIALLVEPMHKLKAIHFVVENALERLSDEWQVVIQIPSEAADFITELCSIGSTYKPSERLIQACLSKRVLYIPLPDFNFSDNGIYGAGHWRNQLFAQPSINFII